MYLRGKCLIVRSESLMKEHREIVLMTKILSSLFQKCLPG